jgi:phosphoglycolate phosphatase-like HAD superfamily hydrolase
MRVILFDVDGTLLDARGAGSRALLAAVAEIYGRSFHRNGVAFAGRTDRAIVADLLAANGIPEAEIESGLLAVLRALAPHMRAETEKTPSLSCPGIPSLLAALARQENLLLGLLTGNMQVTAAIKIASAGLDPTLFRVGAFGDETVDRNALPPLALERAMQLVDRPVSMGTVVGDTPADIECARVNSLRSVAVATGPYSPEALSRHTPDHIFPDLANLPEVLAALLG